MIYDIVKGKDIVCRTSTIIDDRICDFDDTCRSSRP